MQIILLSLSLWLLAACGNRHDLMLSAESPPEDARRYLIKPKPAAAPETPARQDSADDDDGH